MNSIRNCITSLFSSTIRYVALSPAATIKRTTSTLLRAHSRNSLNRLLFESEHANGGGSDDRPLAFRCMQVVVLVLRLITPLSYLYIIYLCMVLTNSSMLDNILYGHFSSKNKISYDPSSNDVYKMIYMMIYVVFTIWMIIEACFFPYYCYLFHHLNRNINHNLSHYGSTASTRQQLVISCFEALSCSASTDDSDDNNDASYLYIRKVIEGWFLDVPIHLIYHDNFHSWVSWAFFGKDLEMLSPEEFQESAGYVRYVETKAQWTFPEGKSKDLFALRVTLDPLFATQRPFIFYGSIWFVNAVVHMVIYYLGFRRHRQHDNPAQIVYHRPSSTTYTSSIKPLPIIFIHGIGIGFAHYLRLLMNFPVDTDVYLIEWPHVAMQLSASVPTSAQVVDGIINLLETNYPVHHHHDHLSTSSYEHLHHQQACFVAHSLGTTVISWLLKHPIGQTKVGASILIDPVTFLLCDPTVATTFVYKDPHTTIDFMMHFFVSRELYIANSLSRHFSWSENILFLEELEDISSSTSSYQRQPHQQMIPSDDDIHHTIIISTNDTIIPVKYVTRYLTNKARQATGSSSYGRSYEILFLQDMLHGELFLYHQQIKQVIDKIRLRCGLNKMINNHHDSDKLMKKDE